jgi:hypothetical protein
MKFNHLSPLLGVTTIALVSMTVPASAIAVNFQVESGVTSVFLDVPLLQSVGLSLTDTSDDVAAPVNDEFLIGFNITPDTDFTFTTENGFAPVSGSIEHIGSVTFNDEVTVGNFSIGFDPARTAGQASGFFVQDTLDDVGAILFNIAIPETVAFDGEALTLGANLLVSQEFASVLGNASLTGAVVGKAQVDADTASVPEPASALAVIGAGLATATLGKRRFAA